MIAVAERSPFVGSVTDRCPEQGRAARDLALGYLRDVCACWRGDAGASVFTIRLGAYWCSDLPLAPDGPPDAMSPHGGGGRGIHWYQTGDDVLGYVPGGRGGYRVPVRAIARLVRCAPPGPWTTPNGSQGERGSACPDRQREKKEVFTV
jgi:hypothetical protein